MSVGRSLSEGECGMDEETVRLDETRLSFGGWGRWKTGMGKDRIRAAGHQRESPPMFVTNSCRAMAVATGGRSSGFRPTTFETLCN